MEMAVINNVKLKKDTHVASLDVLIYPLKVKLNTNIFKTKNTTLALG